MFLHVGQVLKPFRAYFQLVKKALRQKKKKPWKENRSVLSDEGPSLKKLDIFYEYFDSTPTFQHFPLEIKLRNTKSVIFLNLV